MRSVSAAVTALAAVLLLSACGEVDSGKESAVAEASASGTPELVPASAEEGSVFVAGESGETVRKVENCVLETPKGHYDGPCERVEWGGPSFSIRRGDGSAFLDGITEVVVEVDRPGEDAGGSYRRGAEGDLVPTGPLAFRDDCACWVRPDFRVGAFAAPQ